MCGVTRRRDKFDGIPVHVRRALQVAPETEKNKKKKRVLDRCVITSLCSVVL